MPAPHQCAARFLSLAAANRSRWYEITPRMRGHACDVGPGAKVQSPGGWKRELTLPLNFVASTWQAKAQQQFLSAATTRTRGLSEFVCRCHVNSMVSAKLLRVVHDAACAAPGLPAPCRVLLCCVHSRRIALRLESRLCRTRLCRESCRAGQARVKSCRSSHAVPCESCRVSRVASHQVGSDKSGRIVPRHVGVVLCELCHARL
jgi:hypothetical protein